MSDVHWSRVTDLVGRALERPLSDRLGWLTAETTGDESLLADVTRLLDAHTHAGQFLEQPLIADPVSATAFHRALVDATSPSVMVGARLGQYRLLRELGHGGMGTVYLATRADEVFEKHVAIKVVPGARVSDTLRDRFTRERRLLALLEHPGIARVIDAGATDEGLQYLVMEYVEGVAIDVYCRTHALDVNARIRLVLAVCDAVQYAHGRLIVHRDLKPSNILVAEDGRPRLVDFGIGKLLASDDADASATMVHAWTPESASPEQVRGEPATTATDVYGLGALIYRLLTGHPALDVAGRSATDRAHLICNITPEAPSVGAAREPLQAGGVIARDLDLIVLKALHKDPAQRYRSVTHLADDLERHLSDRPVLAAPDRWTYRVGKFLRRHPVAAAATMVAAVALTSTAGVATWQARRAESERAQARAALADVRRLANTLVFDVFERLRDTPNATSAQRFVLEQGLAYLDRVSVEAPTDVTLSLEMANAYQRMASVQGGGNANLGDRDGAIRSLERARAVLRPFLTASDARLDVALRDLDLLLDLSGVVRWQNRDDGRRLTAEGVASAERLQTRHPGHEEVEQSLARAYFFAAQSAAPEAQPEMWSKANAAYTRLLDRAPDDPVRIRNVALTDKYLCANHVTARSFTAARQRCDHALALDRRVLALHPTSRQAVIDVAIDLGQLGALLWNQSTPDLAGAIALYEESLALREKAVAGDPQDVFARGSLGFNLAALARLANQTGRPTQALDYGRRAVAIYEALSPSDVQDRRGYTWHALATAHISLGQTSEGCRALRTARRHFQQHLRAHPEIPLIPASSLQQVEQALLHCDTARK